MLLSARVTLRHRAVAYPGVGLPYRGVRLPSSSWGRVAQRWAAHIAVGMPYLSGRLPSVSKLGVGLPTSLWATLPQRSPPLVVVGSRTSAFASFRCRGVACFGIGLPTSLWAALGRRSPPLVVVWCRTSYGGVRVVVGCGPRHCRGVGGERGSEALGTAIGKREQRKWATMKVVARFRDVPHTSHFLAPAPPTLRVLLHRARPKRAHIPQERGGVPVRGWPSLGTRLGGEGEGGW